MKIGVLTYHAPCNFGANLQAYCSMRYLQSLGHEVKIINYVAQEYLNQASCPKIQRDAHWNFCQHTLNTTRIVNNAEDVYHLVKEEAFDMIFIGSDAVWNYANVDDFRIYHADWLWHTELARKIKVFSLSPAFMGQSYSGLSAEERKRFAYSLRRFSFITTRDTWTRDTINKEILGEEIIKTINPDPVFFLDAYCDAEWAAPSSVESKKYYILSLPPSFLLTRRAMKMRWFRAFKKEVNRRGYHLVELPLPEGTTGLPFDYIVPYPIDPLQWYLWLKNAKAFVGLRFHAVVSCLSAGTPFYSLDIYGRSTSRIGEMLNKFGFHRFDHSMNKSSKIRNLLDGSGLEQYRINGDSVVAIRPSHIISKLENFDFLREKSFKETMTHILKRNIQIMLDMVE